MYIVIITSYGKQAGVYTQLGNDSTKTISTLESIHYAIQLTIFTKAPFFLQLYHVRSQILISILSENVLTFT